MTQFKCKRYTACTCTACSSAAHKLNCFLHYFPKPNKSFLIWSFISTSFICA